MLGPAGPITSKMPPVRRQPGKTRPRLRAWGPKRPSSRDTLGAHFSRGREKGCTKPAPKHACAHVSRNRTRHAAGGEFRQWVRFRYPQSMVGACALSGPRPGLGGRIHLLVAGRSRSHLMSHSYRTYRRLKASRLGLVAGVFGLVAAAVGPIGCEHGDKVEQIWQGANAVDGPTPASPAPCRATSP